MTKYLLLILLCALCLLSCEQRNVERAFKNREDALQAMKEAEGESREISDPAERLGFWKDILKEAPFAEDSVVRAKVHYQMAGAYYGKFDIDSIKYHMRRAWDYMERQQGHEDITILLNVGEGNIAHIEQGLHQSNYYFNLASRALISNEEVDLLPIQRVNIFLATAQSDANLFQYEQSIAWNRKALDILVSEEVNVPDLLYRSYSQLALDFLQAPGERYDSAYVYIEKMAQVVEEFELSPRYVYDRKASYFTVTEQLDSAVYYHRLILEIDEELIAMPNASAIVYSNLFKDYINLSDGHLQLRQMDRSAYYLKKSEDFIQSYGHFLSTREFILLREHLVNYLFMSRQYVAAYEEHKQLLRDTRELNENKYSQAIAEMSAIYELQANEKSILELNKQVLLKETQLSQNRLLLIITALSALLAIAILFLLYSKRKQRLLEKEKEQVQLQKSAMELEQRLLRTQMEPHFIFNTLSALQSYIRLEEKDKALSYLKKFSRLLRNSLELSRESQVNLDEELETLEYYLGLQQMRYEESFDYTIHKNLDSDMTSQILIPPMLIQPFVENAIIHGVGNREAKGDITVEISLSKGEEVLQVEITDNGPGIGATRNKVSGKKKSLSTSISRERLEILAREKGVKVDIQIVDRKDCSNGNSGTVVKIRIPVIFK